MKRLLHRLLGRDQQSDDGPDVVEVEEACEALDRALGHKEDAVKAQGEAVQLGRSLRQQRELNHFTDLFERELLRGQE